VDWGQQAAEQLEFHWNTHLRPKLEGLSDEEYLWEPAPGAWSVRRREEARTPLAVGGGEWVMDWAVPEPSPAPVTTIAWRLGHVLVGLFGMRNAAHFGGPPIGYQTVIWPTSATEMLERIDDGYRRWVEGVSSLSGEDWPRPVGPAEGLFADAPYAALVLHINREVIHHGAEVLLLRDLYRSRT